MGRRKKVDIPEENVYCTATNGKRPNTFDDSDDDCQTKIFKKTSSSMIIVKRKARYIKRDAKTTENFSNASFRDDNHRNEAKDNLAIATLAAKRKARLPSLAKSYLRFLELNDAPKFTDIKPCAQVVCPCSEKKSDVKILTYFVYHTEPVVITFCSCKNQSKANILLEMGLMPASSENPRTAVHLGLMEFMLNIRETLAASGQNIIKFCNSLTNNHENPMSETLYHNLIPIYTELMQIVSSLVKSGTSINSVPRNLTSPGS